MEDWIAAIVDGVPRARVDRLSSALWDAGAAGVQEEPATGHAWTLRQPWEADLPTPSDPDALKLTAWFDGPDPHAVSHAVQAVWPDAVVGWSRDGADVDWDAAWRDSIVPITVGPITLAPPWNAPPGALVLTPGVGFGTGRHETTRQALQLLLDALARHPGGTVLDIGTGSGVLALAAAQRGHAVAGVDVEAGAIDEARQHAAHNGLRADFSTTPVHALTEPADVVVANVHAEALVAMAADLQRLTRGTLVLAGIVDDREAAVHAAYRSWGPPSDRRVDGEWVALAWIRPPA